MFVSTGFYYDPNAGWYYSSRDGLYYAFKDGNYVPLSKDEELEAYPHARSECNELVQKNSCLRENSSSDGNDPQCMPSEWLEDTLINMYLSGYSNLEFNSDDPSRDLQTNREEKSESISKWSVDKIEGESIPENVQDAFSGEGGNATPEEEMWLAQYGQVVRTNDEDLPSFPIVDLWDWEMVREPVSKRHEVARLVGRLVRRSSKLHPSLPAGGGLLRTNPIREVHLDLVRVASGKVYRLKNPSRKYLASLSVYDSSNPTKDWGFPDIYANQQSTVLHTLNPECGSDFSNAISEDNISSVINDIPLEGMKHQKFAYRDRAAERRCLHGGIGIGPGHKDVMNNDDSSEDAKEAAAEAMELSFGSGSYGRRVLESMGWKEGEALGGSTKGILEPLQAVGNKGYAGLGWSHTRGKS
ncbi:hypothetical protein ACMD2_17212 [Ananas comosus]|uniref:G-patch domain-containing protein n=1 Tax=Ananas comosus TaxID=4615 RepID=A0A199UVH7_ANACO|nr:hypothetical protein ACMD2_17212 [Ananas comosus]